MIYGVGLQAITKVLLQYTMFASCAGNSDLIDFLEQNLASFSLRSSN